MTFAAFARAPFLWSVAVLAIYAPFVFLQPVVQERGDCEDWLWCDARYVGLILSHNLDTAHLWALLIIPGAFLGFLAAYIDGRGASRSAHWYMAPFVVTLVGLTTYFLIQPFGLFINVSESYRPAVIVNSLHVALTLAIFASVLCGLIVVLGALVWRWFKRSAAS